MLSSAYVPSSEAQRSDLPTRRHQWKMFPPLNFPSGRLSAGAELDVAPCWHADPVMNRSASHYDAPLFHRRRACFPERVPPMHHHPLIAQLISRWLCRGTALGIPRTSWGSRLFRDLFFFFLLCCVAIFSFAFCVRLIELQLQLNYESLHTLFLWNFEAACVSLNPKSLWNDAKKYRCGISCRLLWQICWLVCPLAPLDSPQKHLKSFFVIDKFGAQLCRLLFQCFPSVQLM